MFLCFWEPTKDPDAVFLSLCNIPDADWLAPRCQSTVLLIPHVSPLPDPPVAIFTAWGSPTSRKGHSHYQGRSGSLCFGATQVLLLVVLVCLQHLGQATFSFRTLPNYMYYDSYETCIIFTLCSNKSTC